MVSLKDLYKYAIKGIGKVQQYKEEKLFNVKSRARLIGQLFNDRELQSSTLVFGTELKE